MGAVKGNNHGGKARGSCFSVLNEDIGGDDALISAPIEGGLSSGVKGQDKVLKVAGGVGNKEPKVAPLVQKFSGLKGRILLLAMDLN